LERRGQGRNANTIQKIEKENGNAQVELRGKIEKLRRKVAADPIVTKLGRPSRGNFG
jgi:hypothetical protein